MYKLTWVLIILIFTGCTTKSISGKTTTQKTNSITEVNQPHDRENTQSEIENKLINYCKSAKCRESVQVVLKKKDGSIFSYSNPLFSPILQPGFITILAGETLYIEAEAGEKGPMNLKVVDKIEDPDKTITFNFVQNSSIGDEVGMMLKVTNPFNRSIRYRLVMMVPDSDRVFNTSSCPVRAGISVIEMWPHPIFQLIFTDIRFIDEGSDDFSCK